MKLRDRIERLTDDFARQVMAAVRGASLEELSALSRRNLVALSATPPRSSRSPKAPLAPRQPRKGGRTARAAVVEAPAPARVEGALRKAALGIMRERGAKGATSLQLDAQLALLDPAAPQGVMASLARAGVVRDAGFRRAAGGGNATATVYVLNEDAP